MQILTFRFPAAHCASRGDSNRAYHNIDSTGFEAKHFARFEPDMFCVLFRDQTAKPFCFLAKRRDAFSVPFGFINHGTKKHARRRANKKEQVNGCEKIRPETGL
ncbi:MAG: hypothetical protein AAF890_03820 [Pseudomonadota bacterium]